MMKAITSHFGLSEKSRLLRVLLAILHCAVWASFIVQQEKKSKERKKREGEKQKQKEEEEEDRKGRTSETRSCISEFTNCMCVSLLSMTGGHLNHEISHRQLWCLQPVWQAKLRVLCSTNFACTSYTK